MGDMADTFRAMREYKKQKRWAVEFSWTRKLEDAGARFLTDGVYRLGDFDIYPAREYARNYRTNQRTSIAMVLKYRGDSSKFPAPKAQDKIRKL